MPGKNASCRIRTCGNLIFDETLSHLAKLAQKISPGGIEPPWIGLRPIILPLDHGEKRERIRRRGNTEGSKTDFGLTLCHHKEGMPIIRAKSTSPATKRKSKTKQRKEMRSHTRVSERRMVNERYAMRVFKFAQSGMCII